VRPVNSSKSILIGPRSSTLSAGPTRGPRAQNFPASSDPNTRVGAHARTRPVCHPLSPW
jgi:hypothetical protein